MGSNIEVYKKEVERLKDLVSILEKENKDLTKKLNTAQNDVEHYKEKWLEK